MIVPGRYTRLIRALPAALAILLLLGVFAVPLGIIQLRLVRNVAIAKRLTESLREQFPGVGFRGTVSYESERVYITVVTGLDKVDRQQVEHWLRQQKREQNIAPTIWLMFGDDIHDEHKIEIGP